jgi:multimeric flavodoxin WrbA
MNKILAFNGSPRPSGNTTQLLSAFFSGAEENGATPELFHPHKLDLKECTGCLRCNVLKRCSISGDDWGELSAKIIASDVLVFGSPIYFHHVPSSMKKLLDRFRSLVHVRVTETGLIHTPYHEWKKDFVLILSLGASQTDDAQPVIDLFKYLCSIMGPQNKLHVITGTRLAMVKQVSNTEEELVTLYRKMGLPDDLASKDYLKNHELLAQCRKLGGNLTFTNPNFLLK